MGKVVMNSNIESWPLRSPFIIARGTRYEARVIVVTITKNGMTGRGECTPYARYGESEESVLAQINALSKELENGMDRHFLQKTLPAGAARNAIDSALWQLECQQQQKTLWQLTNTQPPVSITIAQTISIDTPEAMAEKAHYYQQKGGSLLKIKLDDHCVSERLMAIRRAVPGMKLIVDANESWSADNLQQRCHLLAKLNVFMLEQPLAADKDQALTMFSHPLIISADESCHTCEDLPAMKNRYDMINIKLDKTGGLTEAIALAKQAKKMGLGVMAGCMLCTSRAITAALPLVSWADLVDFDGPTWLAEDSQPSLTFSGNRILDLSSKPGYR